MRSVLVGLSPVLLLLAGCSDGSEPSAAQTVRSLEIAAPSSSVNGAPRGQQPVDDDPWCRDDSGLDWGRLGGQRAELLGVKLYQGVEVDLAVAPEDRSVDLVAGRKALVRAFISPTDGPISGATLHLKTGSGEVHELVDYRFLESVSEPGALSTTYNFDLEAEWIDEETTIELELFRHGPCDKAVRGDGARFPESGNYALRAREVGGLSLNIIPVIYVSGDVELTPDTSASRLEEIKRQIYARYPVSQVEMNVHSPIYTELTGVDGVLGQIMQLRALEQPPVHEIYFGLVRPAATLAEHCSGVCVSGVSALGSASGKTTSGVALDFPEVVDETFLHELGHIHRLPHAPCGAPANPDVDYPHEDARIGSWGYDMVSEQLIDPSGPARDLMSYCDPTWISDYNYQLLMERIALTNSFVN